jgi:hypothetical protein
LSEAGYFDQRLTADAKSQEQRLQIRKYARAQAIVDESVCVASSCGQHSSAFGAFDKQERIFAQRAACPADNDGEGITEEHWSFRVDAGSNAVGQHFKVAREEQPTTNQDNCSVPGENDNIAATNTCLNQVANTGENSVRNLGAEDFEAQDGGR